MSQDEFRSEMPMTEARPSSSTASANEALVRRIHAAIHGGDPEAFGRELGDDVLWRMPGANLLAGEHQGRDAVMALLRRALELTDGTLHIDLIAAFGDEDYGVLWLRTTAKRGSQRLDMKEALVFAVCDGRVTEVWQRPDQAKFDAFFA